MMYSVGVNSEGTLAAISTAFEGQKAPVYLWDIPANTTNELGTSRDVESFAFSPDGRWLASGHASGYAELWELSTPQANHPFLRWRAHYRELLALALSLIEFVIREFAPLLANFAFELLPIAFHRVPVHGFAPVS